MLKNHRNTLKICLFGQIIKQLSSNFEPAENLENASNIEGWILILKRNVASWYNQDMTKKLKDDKEAHCSAGRW